MKKLVHVFILLTDHLSPVKMFSNKIYIQLKFFTFLGFCPEFFELRPFFQLKSNFTLIILAVHIIILCFAANYTIRFFNSIVEYKNPIESANDSIRMFLTLFAYFCAIVESFLKRDAQRNVWRALIEIYEIYCFRERCINKRYYQKLLLLFVYATIVQISIFSWMVKQHNSLLLQYWCSYILLLSIQYIRIFYYLFFMELLRLELSFLNRELNVIVGDCVGDVATNRKRIVHRKFLCRRLVWVQRYYGLVYTISRLLNNIFSWSHLMTMTLCFVVFLTDFNWAIWYIINQTGLGLMGKF